ncbi:MAG: hypothetical protein U0V70_02825 [Terriglobia bacterium]
MNKKEIMQSRLVCLFFFLRIAVIPCDPIYSNSQNIGFRSVRFVSEKVGFIAGPQGVYYSEDGGGTWNALPLISKSSLYKLGGVEGWESHFYQEGKIIWADSEIALIRGSKKLLVARVRSGKTEEVSTSDNTYSSLRRVTFVNSKEGWGISDEGVYKTIDGGMTWKFVDCDAHGTQEIELEKNRNIFRFTELLKTFTLQDLLLVTFTGEVCLTKNGGCAWEKRRVGAEGEVTGTYGLGFVDDKIGWIHTLSPPMLFVTYDGGKHWKQTGSLQSVCDALIAVSFSTSQCGWASAAKMLNVMPSSCVDEKSGKAAPCHEQSKPTGPEKSKGEMILHTQDFGESWQVQLKGIKDFLIDIQALSNGNVWAVGYTRGVVLHSKDFGKNWSVIKFDKDRIVGSRLSK